MKQPVIAIAISMALLVGSSVAWPVASPKPKPDAKRDDDLYDCV